MSYANFKLKYVVVVGRVWPLGRMLPSPPLAQMFYLTVLDVKGGN
jgi:hypothetical protein